MIETCSAWPFPASVAADYFIRAFSLDDADEAALLRDHLGAGHFYSIAPTHAKTEQLRKLDEGGLFPPREKVRHGEHLVQAVNDCSLALAEVITDALGRASQARLWIHEPLLTAEELAARDLPFKRLGARLYLTHDQGFRDGSQLRDLIDYSLLSWHFLAIATAGDAVIESVDALIRHADLMAAGAYDGEGFLVWLAAGLTE